MATLFVVGVFVAPNSAIPAIAPTQQPQQTQTRSVTSRETTNTRNTAKTLSTKNKSKTHTTTSPTSTLRHQRISTSNGHTQNRAATKINISNYNGNADNDPTLTKMYVDSSLRSDSNIQKYIELSGGSDYILIKLFNTKQLPNFARMFQRLGGTLGAYNDNSTTSTLLVDSSGEQESFNIPNQMWLIKSTTTTQPECTNDSDCENGTCDEGNCISSPAPECSNNSDCGAGMCNSGTCSCDANATKVGNECQCNNGYTQNGTSCVLEQPTDPNLISCTGAENEIIVDGGKCVLSPFSVITKNKNSFQFGISATGTFYIDWGDGDVQTLNRTDTTYTTVSHTYETADNYTVRFGGKATGYSTDETIPAIRFHYSGNCDVYGISGSLGAIFGTVDNGGNGNTPRFYQTFAKCIDPDNYSTSSTIPEDLFTGVTGAPLSYMFYETFNASNFKDTSAPQYQTIPNNLFSGISGAPAAHMFEKTFRTMEYLDGSLSSDLFAGISGAPAPYMFANTFAYSGGAHSTRKFTISADLFKNISGNPAPHMFESTFEGSWLTNLPVGLFAGIYGAPATAMYLATFKSCKHISGGVLANNFFGDIAGDAVYGMFMDTFSDVTGINGTIPAQLFGTLSGTPKGSMFSGTFSGCTGLTGTIPGDLFGNISGPTMTYSFASTFSGCSGITGIDNDLFKNITVSQYPDSEDTSFSATFYGTGITSIPSGLFRGITNLTQGIFTATFENCTALQSIPGDLFGNISSVSPINSSILSIPTNIFNSTFAGCTNLQSIPSELFAGIEGAPAAYIFRQTFKDCTSLQSLPNGLFSRISGAPANGMFYGTFYDCTGLQGSIPSDFFGNVSGAVADYMFDSAFKGCTNLGGTVPASMYSDLTPGTTANYIFSWTFSNTSLYKSCPSGTKPDPLANEWEQYWSGHVACIPGCTTDADCGAGTCDTSTSICACSTNATKVGNECQCNNGYTQSGTQCIAAPCPNIDEFMVNGECINSKFEITTTNDATSLSFELSAQGTFYVDCGDDGTLSGTGSSEKTITKNDTTDYEYQCSWTNAGVHTVKFAGLATGYSRFLATIDFHEESNIEYISGSLGAIFPTIGNGDDDSLTPNFYHTFKNCTNLKNISDGLFNGITAGRKLMFGDTFYGCDGLTAIPAGLFSNITTSAEQMFEGTFEKSAITEIPERLFSSITTGANKLFYRTFFDCGNLSGYIPASAFAGLLANTSDLVANTFLYPFTYTDLLLECPNDTTPIANPYQDQFDANYAICEPN